MRRRFPQLEYSGFDIVKYGIDWAGKRLSDADTFALHYANVANPFYNPRGKIIPESYRFPFASSSQDLAFATSVFTHLLEPTARNYLREMARCLNEGGRGYVTTFILDEVQHERAAFTFRTNKGLAAIASEQEPEMAVAYSLDAWHEMASTSGLIIEQVFRGHWRDDGQGDDFQDAVLLRKPQGNMEVPTQDERPETACELFTRTFREMPRNQGVTVEEWHDVWDDIHRSEREAGRPCRCGG